MNGASLWYLLFLCLGLALGWRDWRERKVSNKVLLAALLAQSAWLATWAMRQAAAPTGAADFAQAGLGFALGMLTYPLWRMGKMGAGDVKALAALGFLLGPLGLAATWVLGTLLALAHALSAVLRGAHRAPGRRVHPYVAHLVCGALLWLWFSATGRA
ncbi:PROBABLE PREPILIN PEPTIDASE TRANSMEMBRANE PROTEIN [plant metagenome]|uniref:PROBABLE PREPILIN PEPTIDASE TRANSMEMBRANE PROTEIN n=2 Tax=root TaxID=1 RepID=A0A1C3K085_9BURK|nr:prepilin peptidase [Orrella dioscoreae]SBT24923.1 PROBABLE PREPILIN PEPTIDASE TRANSMEMBRANE PROTEIN [Orrella dioscoreae]SOE50723.1 PROBABLE PREPILIN PEPTIDASE TRANSMEMBRANE PROTEIN [Orrella dioscoreae]